VAVRWAAGLMFAGAALVAGEIAAQIALMNTVSYSGNGGNFFPEASHLRWHPRDRRGVCPLGVDGVYGPGRPWMGADRVQRLLRRHVPATHRLHPRFSVTCGCVTSTGPFIGTVPLVRALPLISGALEWLVGLAAVILIWQRAPSQFYAASRQARAVFREPRR
jgi:hypothetical protein